MKSDGLDNLTLSIIKDKKSLEKIQTKDDSEGSWYKAYKKAFPIKDEREDPEGFLYMLKESKQYPEWQDYIIMSLEDQKGKVVGGATANRLTSDDYTIAVFEYLFLDKAYRGKGLVDTLTKARLNEVQKQADKLGSKFVATLAETENLEKMSAEDLKEIDPKDVEARRKLLSRLGYKIIDMPYVQLPLDEGFEHVHHLDLLIRPTDEKKDVWKDYIPSKELKKMLGMYAEVFTEDFKEDPEYQKMMNYLSKKEKIPLKPLI